MGDKPPAVTKQEALEGNEWHENIPHPSGKRCYIWRRNGATKTWKTQPEKFRVPIKYGYRSYEYLDNITAELMHTPENCPLKGEDNA